MSYPVGTKLKLNVYREEYDCVVVEQTDDKHIIEFTLLKEHRNEPQKCIGESWTNTWFTHDINERMEVIGHVVEPVILDDDLFVL